MSKTRRSYSREFKQEAVKLVLQGGISVARAACCKQRLLRRCAARNDKTLFKLTRCRFGTTKRGPPKKNQAPGSA